MGLRFFVDKNGILYVEVIMLAGTIALDSLIVSLIRLCVVVLPLAWLISSLEKQGP